MNKKIKHYAVISGLDEEDIENSVADAIDQGYQPLGPVQVVIVPPTEAADIKVMFYQTMVK